MKRLVLLLFLLFFVGSAQARCIVNHSKATIRVDISFLSFNSIREWVQPGESRCIPYNFLATTYLYSDTPNEYGVHLSSGQVFFFTTNSTKITVTDGRRWSSNGVNYLWLDFSREN